MKILIAICLILVVSSVYIFELHYLLSLGSLQQQHGKLSDYFATAPATFTAIFFVIYILSVAISIPGATVLSLAAGSLMGLALGVVFVSFASTIGACFAFLLARFLFRDFIQTRYRDKLRSINEGVRKEGGFYLFSMRLVPLFPFFLINLLMALTPMKVRTFFFVSQIGMLPGTIVYVNAGTQLGQIENLEDILSFRIISSFLLIAFLPWLSRLILNMLKKKKYYKNYKKPQSFDYNLVVIGGGAAGLVSSYIGSTVKAKVLLIEKNKMGGDCLNTGCVPSKTLIKSANVLHELKSASAYGHEAISIHTDFQKVMERVQSAVKKIEPHDSVERYKSLGVNCEQGHAFIRSPYEVEVNGRVVTAKNIIMATGASPVFPNIKGINEVNALTSETLWKIQKLPKRLLVLGAGAIGCEMAQAFCRLGSHVSLVEIGERILSKEDESVSKFIKERFIDEGIEVLTSHQITSFQRNGEKKLAFCLHNNKEKEIEFDEVLICLGRKARTKGFGLEDLNVEINSDGTIAVDEFMRTTHFTNIFACGDVAGPFQFTHTASHQAWYASVNALFSPFKKFRVDYRVIPRCTFVSPEVASVGLNEVQAKSRFISYDKTTYNLKQLDRAIADGTNYGFVEVLTAPKSDKILGVTIVGERASDTISEFVLAMKYGIGLNKLLGTIHLYPSYSEANKSAAGEWRKLNAPKNLLKLLKVFHRWRRT